MPRERRAFRQSDVTAAIKAVKRAGESVARVEVDPDGTVTVYAGQPEEETRPGRPHGDAAEKILDALRSKKQTRRRQGPAS